ncbi:MAG: acetyl-CoA carboxylase biotin carboxyl carrier protein [Thermoflexibacteraceae bacterium]|jgi:acetyl-CoA carboxylase biotin carboxyl carrier protein
MKSKEIQDLQELIGFIAESGLEEVVIETGAFKLKTRRSAEGKSSHVVSVPQVVATPTITPISATPVAPQTPATPVETAAKPVEVAAGGKIVAVKSPMIGTFYRSASPTNPPFVNVGDTISKGQVVCIIEAMKLFNEIESEVSGKVVKVLVDNASPVEYDQDLFLVELA